MDGTLYGVGIGPGDPELLTLKAVRTITECEYIAIPSENKEACTAYQITRQAIPAIAYKKLICITMPMTKNQQILQKSHAEGAAALETVLKGGSSIAFLTLGDPAIYSTYLYLHRLVEAHGYPTGIISGIPSFCAAAAVLNQGLVTTSEPLHILPGSYPISDMLALTGTKVIMKTGTHMNEVKKELKTASLSVSMVENCGMKHEKCYFNIDSIPDESSYYSLLIVK